MAIGQISTGILLSHFALNRHVGAIMLTAVTVFGLANLVFSLSTMFVSFASLLIAGGADMVSVRAPSL